MTEETANTMCLQFDVIGPYSEIAYGLAGERVKIISDHGNVLIVEGSDGKRYPIKNHNAEYFIPDNYKSDRNGIKQKPPVKARSKTIKQESQQNQLFNL